METAFEQCNKRAPGSGCAARDSFNREHAIFGASDACVAILDASVHVHRPAGRRSVPIGEFVRLPGDEPQRDNTLRAAELSVGIELPPSPFAKHSWFLKVRDRHSYAFALGSVAAGCASRTA